VKRLLRRLPMVLLAAGLLAALVYGFWPAPVGVDLGEVARGSMLQTVDEDGKTRIKDRYVVSAPVAGRMHRVPFKPGDAVQGTLFVIEPPSPTLLDSRARDEAQARVKAGQARLKQAQASLEEAKADEVRSRARLERLRKLGPAGASPQEVEEALAEERMKTERVRASQFAVHVSEYELEQARAALKFLQNGSPGEKSVWQFEVPSPVPNGKVLRVLQESATAVTTGTNIIEVGDPRNLEAEIDLLTTDAVKVHEGDRALLEHWGGGKAIEGHVRRIEPSGFTKTSALGVEEQRVNVIIDFTVPDDFRTAFGDAYRVEARIIIWEGKDVVKVPSGALFRRESGQAVFVAEGGRAVLRRVKIGHNNGLEAEVLEGLKPGEQVLLHPGDKVKDGVAIAPRPQD
jgi:HlyD family secretion protein